MNQRGHELTQHARKGRFGWLLRGAAAAQEEVADKEERKRDAKADFEKIEELMGQRRESLGSLAQPGWTYHHNNDSALDLEQEWQEEERAMRAVVDKVISRPSPDSLLSHLLLSLSLSLHASSSLYKEWECVTRCVPRLNGYGCNLANMASLLSLGAMGLLASAKARRFTAGGLGLLLFSAAWLHSAVHLPIFAPSDTPT